MNVNIRWMIRRDLPRVLEIEQASFPDPWEEEDFLTIMKTQNVIGMICENHEDSFIMGFIIYEVHDDIITILSMAVDPMFYRKKIGTLILDKMKLKLTMQKRVLLECLVKESNLIAQLFFRQNNFLCHEIVKKPYENCEEDAYLMSYSVSNKEDPKTKNRTSDFFNE